MKFPTRAKSLQYSRRRAVCDSTLTIRPLFLRDEIEEIEDDQKGRSYWWMMVFIFVTNQILLYHEIRI